jgi:hypothetical protein
MLILIWLLFAAHVLCYAVTFPDLSDNERIGGALFTIALLSACLLASSL